MECPFALLGAKWNTDSETGFEYASGRNRVLDLQKKYKTALPIFALGGYISLPTF